MKQKILLAAGAILINEGYENLSIRKIASMIAYSPGTIYHYFRDKGEIVAYLAADGYKKIVRKLQEIPVNEESPEETLREVFTAYIELILSSPFEFQPILLQDIPEIRDQVAILPEGVTKQRQSIALLCQLLELGIAKRRFRPLPVELTAQILWTATFGLITRLLLEKEISIEQRGKLIRHHFDLLMHGLILA